jgi:environmental stress-induced protein Ves
MPLTLVRWDDLTAKPWKNGGGTTRQLAIAPAGADFADFDWSVSLAEIEQAGPFSEFPGIDRTFMLVDGAELILDVEGTAHRLATLDTLAFPGDATTACRLQSGPARALNLMTRRGRAAGSSLAVAVTAAAGHEVTTADGEAVVLVALTDGLSLDGGAALGPRDSVVWDEPGSVRVTGNGTLAELRIDTRPTSGRSGLPAPA